MSRKKNFITPLQRVSHSVVAALQLYSDELFIGDTAAIIALEPVIRFNGGGHLNHSIFWTNLAPKSGGDPSGTT